MALEIAPSAGPLSTTSPNLMPFHIEYTGPAPISRYFRPKSAPTSDVTRNLTATPSSSSVVTLTGESLPPRTSTSKSQDSIMSHTSLATSVTVVEALDLNLNETNSALQINSSSEHRLVAAFRGRQIVGHPVNIPTGYSGLVLQIPSPNGEKGKGDGKSTPSNSEVNTKPASMRCASRKSTGVRNAEVDVIMEEGVDLTEEDPGDGNIRKDARQLIPMSTFSSFTIWSPDIPVDEGKDEYIRCLVEWTKLAAEVHK
ncbi:hypothetical protein SCLCIDRAFT_106373 [Scleroderma citrinum Foug A]|uniref:Uncharacterized protein n=1 Tax=Scleroderma citrinum Foug A TaxID=1036808 RepID=A0A0C3EIV8_9AGAM|nr:hypothetical protein SCLCIDRAFT_106373 [Scleroderma citrinum Foug A]